MSDSTPPYEMDRGTWSVTPEQRASLWSITKRCPLCDAITELEQNGKAVRWDHDDEECARYQVILAAALSQRIPAATVDLFVDVIKETP